MMDSKYKRMNRDQQSSKLNHGRFDRSIADKDPLVAHDGWEKNNADEQAQKYAGGHPGGHIKWSRSNE